MNQPLLAPSKGFSSCALSDFDKEARYWHELDATWNLLVIGRRSFVS